MRKRDEKKNHWRAMHFFILYIIYAIGRIRYDEKMFMRYHVEPFRSMRGFLYYARPYYLDKGFILPDNICNFYGEEILSWRVAYALTFLSDVSFDEVSQTLKSIDLQSPWDSPSNLKLSTAKPQRFFYPSFEKSTDGSRTCTVRIKEIHEKIKAGELSENEKKKAYIVLIAAKDSVPWMKPQDISWKDLAEHRVELFPYCRTDAIYITAGGEMWNLREEEIPDSYEEWRNFCGTD